MANILKLNEISEVADKFLPAGYVFGKDVKNPDGIMLRSFNMHEYPLNDELLAVARAGAGTNNIPIDKCTEKGIVVFNTPGANANAVKELVLCELFLGGRKITDAILSKTATTRPPCEFLFTAPLDPRRCAFKFHTPPAVCVRFCATSFRSERHFSQAVCRVTFRHDVGARSNDFSHTAPSAAAPISPNKIFCTRQKIL